MSTSGKSGNMMFVLFFVFCTVALALAIVTTVGMAIPAVFWGLWYHLSGSIPKLMGYSRFWLDSISMPFYIAAIFTYVVAVQDALEELSNKGTIKISFLEFAYHCPWLTWFAPFLVVDFVSSIFLSFAMGIAGIVAFAIVSLVWHIIDCMVIILPIKSRRI